MWRFFLTAGVLASAATGASAQPPAGAATPPDPVAAAVEPPPTPPPVASYVPGDGLTVSLLNGTSSVKLFAQFSALGQAATTRPFPAGGTLFLLPRPDSGNPTNTFDLHARQTGFGAVFKGPEVLGLTPGAYFLAFIQNDNLTSDAYGFLPFNAYGELTNDNWRFAAGLMRDVFNPANPTMISLLNLYASGNTGSFAGQARVEHFFKPTDAFQLTTQLAVREPVASVVTSNRRLIEDNGWPNVEARVAAGLGAAREVAGRRTLRPVEVGVSGVVGQLRNVRLLPAATGDDILRSTIDVWGLGADVQAAVTDRFGLIGEFHVGQGLGEYNGAVGQSFNGTTLQAVRSAGAFGEAYLYFSDRLHLHAGYGIDAPVRRDLAASQVARNQTYFANLVFDASKAVQVSFEVDYRKTDYTAFRDADGVVFVSQFLWRF